MRVLYLAKTGTRCSVQARGDVTPVLISLGSALAVGSRGLLGTSPAAPAVKSLFTVQRPCVQKGSQPDLSRAVRRGRRREVSTGRNHKPLRNRGGRSFPHSVTLQELLQYFFHLAVRTAN